MYLRHTKKMKGKSKWGHSLSSEVRGLLWIFYNNQITKTSGFNLHPSQKPRKQRSPRKFTRWKKNLSTKSSREAKSHYSKCLQSTKRKLCAGGTSHFHHPLVNCGYPRLPGKPSHSLPSEALRRQGRKTFVQPRLDLLIWWHWVITHPQSFLDLLPLPSLDMLSNPTSLILSDQRTKNVLHSLRNCSAQSRFLDLVLWTCLSTKPVFQFHFCRCEKAPWGKGNLRKKGVHFSSQSQVPIHHYGAIKAGTSNSYSLHI